MLLTKPELELAKCAAEDSRFALGCLAVTPTHTEISDGHKVIRWTPAERLPDEEFPTNEATAHLSEPQPESRFLIPAAAALSAAKAIPKRTTQPILSRVKFGVADTGGIVLAATDLEAWNVQRVAPDVGAWPRTDRVIPLASKVKATVVLGVDHLEAICQRAKAFGITGLRLDIIGPEQAVTLSAHRDDMGNGTDAGEFLCVLMPMRSNYYRDGHSKAPKPPEPEPETPKVNEPDQAPAGAGEGSTHE